MKFSMNGSSAAIVACALIAGAAVTNLHAADATTAAKQAASGDLFAPVADVLLHPRCINCHTMTDYPRQANDRHRHQFLIMRGADDRGAIGARCTQCHQSENQVGSGVPGAADWRLAPLQMAWETKPGIAMTKAELCRRILDKSRNGFRDLRALEEHMEGDHFVHWAWDPGIDPAQHARETPPLSHAVFMQAVRRWTAAGAPCPK